MPRPRLPMKNPCRFDSANIIDLLGGAAAFVRAFQDEFGIEIKLNTAHMWRHRQQISDQYLPLAIVCLLRACPTVTMGDILMNIPKPRPSPAPRALAPRDQTTATAIRVARPVRSTAGDTDLDMFSLS